MSNRFPIVRVSLCITQVVSSFTTNPTTKVLTVLVHSRVRSSGLSAMKLLATGAFAFRKLLYS